MKNTLLKVAGVLCLMAGVGASCFGALLAAPEIDPAGGANALALVTGALLIIRSRRK
ncbi:MAG TPA: hypothetical protein VMB85_11085 [Bryobacteraceae bacterium]|jgi:hypothetical protein|nr:hypothetical protein [Bryobacteraceae bacterium]